MYASQLNKAISYLKSLYNLVYLLIKIKDIISIIYFFDFASKILTKLIRFLSILRRR